MNSVSGTTKVNPMAEIDITMLSIEDALYVVNMVRMKNAESIVTIKMTAAQARNLELSDLNKAYAALQNLSSGFPANSSTTTKLSVIPEYQTGGYAKERAANDALENAGLLTSNAGLGLTKNGIKGTGQPTGPYAINGSTTKLEIDNAMTTMKSRIDTLSSNSQTDMIELQSASGKFSSATDSVSANLKKFQDLIDKIISNMR